MFWQFHTDPPEPPLLWLFLLTPPSRYRSGNRLGPQLWSRWILRGGVACPGTLCRHSLGEKYNNWESSTWNTWNIHSRTSRRFLQDKNCLLHLCRSHASPSSTGEISFFRQCPGAWWIGVGNGGAGTVVEVVVWQLTVPFLKIAPEMNSRLRFKICDIKNHTTIVWWIINATF